MTSIQEPVGQVKTVEQLEKELKEVQKSMKRLESEFEELKVNLYEVLQGILGGIDICFKKGIDLNKANDDDDDNNRSNV